MRPLRRVPRRLTSGRNSISISGWLGRAKARQLTQSARENPAKAPPMSEMTVSSINDRAAEEYYRRGQDAENQGLHEKAVEFFERALNENSDHEGACFR